jgi:hypothetical protein
MRVRIGNPKNAFHHGLALTGTLSLVLLAGCPPFPSDVVGDGGGSVAQVGQDPPPPEIPADTPTVTLSAAVLPGAGETLVYQGREYRGEVTVPFNTLVGTVKDGRALLYNPALGDVVLSEETSFRAVEQFIAGPAGGASPASAKALGICARGLGVNETTVLGTGVAINRPNEQELRLVNNRHRWVAAKAIVQDGTANYYYLSALSRTFDGNLLRWFEKMGIETSSSVFGTNDSFTVPLNSGTVETYGAVVRILPEIQRRAADGRPLPGGLMEGFERDPDLMILINEVDFFYVLFEGLKCVTNVAMLVECGEIPITAALNAFETGGLAILTGDDRAALDFKRVMVEDFADSLLRALAEAGSGEAPGIIVNTVIDITSAIFFAKEECPGSPWINEELANADAYADITLGEGLPSEATGRYTLDNTAWVSPTFGGEFKLETGPASSVANAVARVKWGTVQVSDQPCSGEQGGRIRASPAMRTWSSRFRFGIRWPDGRSPPVSSSMCPRRVPATWKYTCSAASPSRKSPSSPSVVPCGITNRVLATSATLGIAA